MNDIKIPDKNETITFSIITPTKNRSEVLPLSIGSVLSQHYQNWELILVDNSGDTRTADFMRQYNDPRIHYVKTGGLSLQENWEEGYKHAHGEYTLLLRDKDLLIDGALDVLAKMIDRYEHPEIVSWKHTIMHLVSGFIEQKRKCTIESVSTTELLQDIYSFEWLKFDLLAPQTSIMRMSLIKKLHSSPPNKLWYGAMGDVVIRYRTLLCNPKGLYYISVPLSVTLWPFDATGNSIGKNKKTDEYLRLEGLVFEDLFKYVPIKHLSLLNVRYNDLLKYDTECEDGKLREKLNWDNYYRREATSYWKVVREYGFGSPEEQEFRQNIMRYHPEFFETYVYPPWYEYVVGRLLKNHLVHFGRVKDTLIRAVHDPMPLQKRMSMIKLAILQTFRDDKRLIPFYSRHARKHIPIHGHICETLKYVYEENVSIR